jgi:hypothetical protein
MSVNAAYKVSGCTGKGAPFNGYYKSYGEYDGKVKFNLLDDSGTVVESGGGADSAGGRKERTIEWHSSGNWRFCIGSDFAYKTKSEAAKPPTTGWQADEYRGYVASPTLIYLSLLVND